MLRMNGIEPAKESMPPELTAENIPMARCVRAVTGLHTIENVPLLDIVAACRLYGVDDVRQGTDAIIDVIIALRNAHSKPPTEEPPPWKQ